MLLAEVWEKTVYGMNWIELLLFFTDTQLTRKTPPAYLDGVYMLAGQDRPSPRKLSQVFMKGADGLGSTQNRTAMLAFFGKKGYL